MDATRVICSRTSGQHLATKVVVASPFGSRYDGMRGVIVHVTANTPFVRIADGMVLPFGFSELREVA